jgi:hypothetical protein
MCLIKKLNINTVKEIMSTVYKAIIFKNHNFKHVLRPQILIIEI